MERAETSWIKVGDVRLAYARHGDPDSAPLVMLHAAGQDASTWNVVVPALARTCCVYTPDFRGHGLSDWPGIYSFELMRDDVLGFVDALGLRQVTLLGHSMGGTVAWLVAQEHPSWLARLVVEDSVPPRSGDQVRIRPRGDAPPTRDPLLTPVIADQLGNPDPAWWDRVGQVTVPTLLLAGGPASHVPQERIAEAAALMAAGWLVQIPAGHQIHREMPTQFVAAVEAFRQAG